uniref:Interferon regulatory factor 3 n=1 Tax=Cavia porcellus TaxID=10141 RepID=A0A286XHV8_CAVPO
GQADGISGCFLQEDILDVLSDIGVSLPDDRAQEQCPQHLLSYNLDNPMPCPNRGPSENPLKLLLLPEEHLIAFIGGSRHSPRYTIWFCLGESWPHNQQWVKRLVMVKVVPTCLKALLNIAQSGGASSLENTVDLHISSSQPFSLTNEQYKACLQDLVEDMDF